MKRTSPLFVLFLSSSALLTPGLVKAIDVGGTNIGIQPRLDVGVMYYDFKQTPVSVTNFSSSLPGNVQYGSNFTQSSLEFTSSMPTLGLGLTFFADRFFLDLYGQKAYNGDDSDTVMASQSVQDIGRASGNPDLNNIGYFGTNSTNYNSDFDRDEYAIAIGYQLTEQLSLFGGYKHAKTDFNTDGTGPFSMLFTNATFGLPDGPSIGPPVQFDGYSSSFIDSEFKYDGPFLGFTYGLNIDQGFFKGGLSFNFAAAALDGEVDVNSKQSNFYVTHINGAPLSTALSINELVTETQAQSITSFGSQTLQSQFQSSGSTLGLTFGVTWRGLTAVKNLTYTLGLLGYNYQFDADRSDYPDITETVVNFRAGIAYAF